MAVAQFPEFRTGKVLATRFTGTLSERYGETLERIPVPSRLADWLADNGLAVDSCDQAHLDRARELRESIHAAATALANQSPLPPSAVRVINECSTEGRASAVLTPEGGREWRLASASPEDALSVIAADAISRERERFRPLVEGRQGVGGVYDLWRRLRARLHGERFQPGHLEQRP